jgi:hypothetical protein
MVYYIFVAYMSHHFGVLNMCASLHCACLLVCFITLQSSLYMHRYIVLLSIYDLQHRISLHIYLITLCFCPYMSHYSVFLSVYASLHVLFSIHSYLFC